MRTDLRNGLNMVWRWLEIPLRDIDDSQNMAIDEAILDSLVSGQCLQTVRVYRWQERCVTIGRHQNEQEARGPYPIDRFFRRPTGGKAVEHGDDLTITVVTDEKSLREGNAKTGILASYHQIVAGIIDTIRSYDVDAITGVRTVKLISADCFEAVGRCDIIDRTTNEKIVGCAQLRSRGAILQQMSLRSHERYHIDSTEFKSRLQNYLALRLSVTRWEQCTSLQPSEYLRSSLLGNG
jgi:lipoate-protein ligase A